MFFDSLLQEGGYRWTVTVGRLVPNVSWWFPSCARCSKSCVPDGAGYRCNACSNTSLSSSGSDGGGGRLDEGLLEPDKLRLQSPCELLESRPGATGSREDPWCGGGFRGR